jgi:hypothetical protein
MTQVPHDGPSAARAFPALPAPSHFLITSCLLTRG